MSAEFDKYAKAYKDQHAQSTSFFGGETDYFAQYKAQHLGKVLAAKSFAPKTILDFGCGIGNSLPHLRQAFPDATVDGADPSIESLNLAKERLDSKGKLFHLTPSAEILEQGKYDLIFMACVLHHVPLTERESLVRHLIRATAPGGLVCVFEHNPYNPLTQRAVSTCPFDADAILLTLSESQRLLSKQGLREQSRAYTLFFPAWLAALRPLEPFLSRIPLGGQYCVVYSR
jgi:SAM-dependent methyltransferase